MEPHIDGGSSKEDPDYPRSSFCGPAPFSDEKAALESLKNCDYSIKIDMQTAKSGTASRAVRVYADGVYDMFHSGHARQLMQAKMAFPSVYLIVGVCSDAVTNSHKGSTVMNEVERYEAVRHCRYVDEVIKASPWDYNMDFIAAHKIDFVAHDDIPYTTSETTDMYKCFKDRGMFLTTQRTECISTTDVIGRILRNYDEYLRRNISRGLSRQELNISFVKEKQLKLEDNIQTIVLKGTHILHNFGSKRREFVDQLEVLYHDVSGPFIQFFDDSCGRLQSWWTRAAAAIKNTVSPYHSSDEEDAEDGHSECDHDTHMGPQTSQRFNRLRNGNASESNSISDRQIRKCVGSDSNSTSPSLSKLKRIN